MAVITAPVGLVAVLFASVAVTVKKFLASEPTPSWTEYLRKCNCEK